MGAKPSRIFLTEFNDRQLGAAVSEVLGRAGWTEHPDGVLVTDRSHADGVLVLRSLPAECALVTQHLGLESLAAILCDDSISQIAVVLAAVVAGHRLIARRAIELAHRLPKLSRRQHQILQHLGRGVPLSELCPALGASPATIKREIASLQRAFEVDNRTQLALAARHAGYPTPWIDVLT
jgi:DNA-binding NarL/FixJ family response regulator